MAKSADCAEVASWDKTVKWTREGHNNRKTFECNAVRNFFKNYNLKNNQSSITHSQQKLDVTCLMKNSIYCRSVVLNCIKANACSSFLK